MNNSFGLPRHLPRQIVLLLAFLLFAQAAVAQENVAEATAPAAPVAATEAPTIQAAQAAENPNATPTPQDKRILGVLPNYRTADGTQPFQPISAKYKLTIAAKDSFDWPNYLTGGAFAALYQLENQNPSFGQGMAGYGRRYATSYADQVIGNMLTEGFMPILLHEDPRYFRKVNGSKWGRLFYSASRVLIAKTDHGKPTVNFAEILGNGIDASIGNFYYPDERGAGPTFERMYTQIATDSLSNVLKEFWPDIKRHLHHKQTTILTPAGE